MPAQCASVHNFCHDFNTITGRRSAEDIQPSRLASIAKQSSNVHAERNGGIGTLKESAMQRVWKHENQSTLSSGVREWNEPATIQ